MADAHPHQEEEQYLYEETQIALDKSRDQLLNISDYIKVTNCWASLYNSRHDESSVEFLLDESVLEWLGYDNHQVRDNMVHFIEFLQSNNIPYQEKENVIMDSEDFRKMINILTTEKANQVRMDITALEKLFKMYHEYEHYFKIKEMQRDNDYLYDRLHETQLVNDGQKIHIRDLAESIDSMTIERGLLQNDNQGIREERNRLQKYIKDIKEERIQLQNDIKDIRDERNQLKNDIKDIEKERNQLKDDIHDIKEERNQLQIDIQDIENTAAPLTEAEKWYKYKC